MTGHQDEEIGELKARIAAIESASRRLQLVCTLLLIIGSLALYQNFKSQYMILDMNGSVNVRDENEQPRAILHSDDFSTGLTFYDEKNADRAMFGASRNGSGLTLRDQYSTQRMILKVNTEGPELLMTDGTGRVRLKIGVIEDSGQIMMYSDEGQTIFDSSRNTAQANAKTINPTQ